MICEMCGTDVPRTKLVMIEGAAVNACPRCEKFASSGAVKTKDGSVMLPSVAERLDNRERRRKERDVFEKGGEMVLALDYNVRVRKGRQKLGLGQEDLAKMINEKKSVIIKVENGDMRPDDKLLQKLERALRISLKESVDASAEVKKSEYSRGMTLGDFIKYED